MANNVILLLRAMLFNKVYSSQTLSFLFESPSCASRCKTDALAKGLIKKVDYKKRERTEHTITLFYMTKRGLKFLLQNDLALSKWMDPNTFAYLSIGKSSDRHGSIRFRVSRNTMCLTLAQMAGAYIPIENYTDVSQAEDDDTVLGSITADKYIASHLTAKLYQELFNQRNASSDMLFYTSRYVKAFAVGNQHKYSDMTTQDFAAGRYSGIITSPFKDLLMYGAPMFGMSWSEWSTEKERAVFRRWSAANSLTTLDRKCDMASCAALVVYNVNQFKNLFFNADMVGRGKADFGGEFSHLYIIPLSWDGARHLSWLMNTDDIAMNREIIQDAIMCGEYSRSGFAASKVFPLQNAEGRQTALGFHLDGKLMTSIRSIATSVPGEMFTVLCYEWQEPFYKAVMPENVEIRTFEMS